MVPRYQLCRSPRFHFDLPKVCLTLALSCEARLDDDGARAAKGNARPPTVEPGFVSSNALFDDAHALLLVSGLDALIPGEGCCDSQEQKELFRRSGRC